MDAALAATGQRVCLIDLDPQAHASLHFGLELRPDTLSIYDVLVGKMGLADVRHQVAENLWVVGSHLDLAAAELELAGVVGREVILRDKLRGDRQEFDYLFIDCPPSLGVLTLNALAAVEEVFIPLQPHFLALHGLSKLLETIEFVARRINDRLKLSGVILCMYDQNTRLAVEVSNDVDDSPPRARIETPRGPAPACFTRGSAGTFAWPRRRASANRSSSTPQPAMGPRTTAIWPKKSSSEAAWGLRSVRSSFRKTPSHCHAGKEVGYASAQPTSLPGKSHEQQLETLLYRASAKFPLCAAEHPRDARSQHNAWIHAAATLAALTAGVAVGLKASEWCWISLAIVAVWTAEALNTAFEFLTDVASPEFHPLAADAKDVAAGAVLIASIGAVIIAALVFGPHLAACFPVK